MKDDKIGNAAKYKALFMSSRDAVMTLEPPTWRFTSGNPAAIAMFATKDEEDFLQYPPWELSSKLQTDGSDSMAKAKEMIDLAIEKGSNFFEWTHKRANGQEFPAEVLLSKIEEEGNTYLHAVVRDITERKRLEEKTKKFAEEKFETIFNGTNDGILLADIVSKEFSLGNKAIYQMLGYDEKELLGLTLANIHPQESLSRVLEQFEKQARGELTVAQGIPVLRKNGSIFYADVNSSSVLIDGKKYLMSVFRDATERINAEKKIKQLANLYEILTECSQAIARSKNEEVLFKKICNDIIHFDHILMAWVGFIDPATKLVNVVASDGANTEYLKNIEISVDPDSPNGRGPTGTSIREKHPFWCQDFQNDPITLPWREKGQLAGWRASASLPLYRGGEVVGTLTLYSGQLNTFDNDAQRLLIEMSMDISYALDNFAREADRVRAEKILESKFDEINQLNKLMVGRELKMIELKNELEKLKGSDTTN